MSQPRPSKSSRKRSNSAAFGGSSIPKQLPSSLKGKRLAVSTRTQKDGGSGDSDNDGNEDNVVELTFNQLQDLCAKTGATVSSQVHKKVHAVIASATAVAAPATQRVRKAWKLNIPVVKIAWIQECQRTKRVVPMESHLFEAATANVVPSTNRGTDAPPSSPKRVAKKAKTRKEAAAAGDDKQAVPDIEPKEIDLGCCCVCHESVAEGTATDCPWCVDCDVNKRALESGSKK